MKNGVLLHIQFHFYDIDFSVALIVNSDPEENPLPANKTLLGHLEVGGDGSALATQEAKSLLVGGVHLILVKVKNRNKKYENILKVSLLTDTRPTLLRSKNPRTVMKHLTESSSHQGRSMLAQTEYLKLNRFFLQAFPF